MTDGKVGDTSNHIDRTKDFMDVACYVIFVQVDDLNNPNRCNQMTVKARFRKFGREAVVAIVKEFTQLNEGAVPGNPAVIPADAKTITSL